MSITLQNLLPNTRSHHHHHNICFYSTHHIHHSPPKTPLFTHSNFPNHSTIPLHLKILSHPKPFTTLKLPLRVFESDGVVRNQAPNEFSVDNLLSIAEFLCLAPSAALSIGWALNWAFFSSQKWVQVPLMNKIIVVQVVLLVGAVGFAALIRRRQWKRICLDSGNSGSSNLNLVERIEKLEEDLRCSATIIRVLSRQVEKLGVRFRVTRKTLKEPISETAALAQKNSEATRALAAQEDNLEKELGEIQKVLLAMQEQQSKQLELILAIGKAGKLRDILREPVAEKEINRVPKSSPDNNGAKQMKTQSQTESIHQGANDKQ